MSTAKITELIDFDPIDVAEKLVGPSETANSLGLLLHIEKTRELNTILKKGDDTTFSEKMANHLRIVKELGFCVVYEEHENVTNKWDSKSTPESYYILWHDDGILMTCDSYMGIGRNSCLIYFNLRTKKDKDTSNIWNLRISGRLGGPDNDVWIGDSDGRTAIRHQIGEMKKVGDFLPQWIESPFLWISPYWDTNKWDNNNGRKEMKEREEVREKKANKRLDSLPENIQRCILHTQ